MIRVEAQVDIERDPETVYAYVSDFENNPAWQAGMVSARWLTDPPLRVGSSYAQVARFLGRRIESVFEVLEVEPGRMVKATTRSGPFPITFTRIVEPRDGGSHVRAIVEGEASGFFRLAEPILERMVGAAVRADYEALKRALDAPEPSIDA